MYFNFFDNKNCIILQPMRSFFYIVNVVFIGCFGVSVDASVTSLDLKYYGMWCVYKNHSSLFSNSQDHSINHNIKHLYRVIKRIPVQSCIVRKTDKTCGRKTYINNRSIGVHFVQCIVHIKRKSQTLRYSVNVIVVSFIYNISSIVIYVYVDELISWQRFTSLT